MLKGKTRRSMALQADPGAFPAPPFPLRNGVKRVENGEPKGGGSSAWRIFLTAKVLEDVGGHPGPELNFGKLQISCIGGSSWPASTDNGEE